MNNKINILSAAVLIWLFNIFASGQLYGNQFEDGGIYIIMSKKTGLALDVYGQKTSDGTLVGLFKENNRQNQRFKIILSEEPGYYYIQGEQSSKFLEYDAAGQLIIKTAGKIDGQKWQLLILDKGYFKIISKINGKSLDIIEGGKDVPPKIVFSDIKENESQLWKIKKYYPSETIDNKMLTEANETCDFEKTLLIFDGIVKAYPDIDNYNIIKQASSAAYLMMLRDLGNINMPEAVKSIDRLESILNRNEKVKEFFYKGCWVEFLKKTISKRTGLGTITPEYTQKVLVLFVSRSEFHSQYIDGKPLDIKAELTREHKILAGLYVNALKAFVETYSGGKLSLEFNIVDVDASFTEFSVSKDYVVPEYKSLVPYPGVVLFENAANGKTDTIIWIYANNVWVHGWGGSAYFPLIPYHNTIELRGFAELHSAWLGTGKPNGIRIYSHEFLHSLHSRARSKLFNIHYTKDDIEKWKPYGFIETDEMGLYWDTFELFIPMYIEEQRAKGDKRGWKLFSYSADRPGKISRETYLFNLSEANKVPIEKRKKSFELKEQADEAWKKGDKALCGRLYEEAFALNPAFYHYYKYKGDRALEDKDYEKAVRMFAEYIRYTDSSNYYRKIGDIYYYNLKDINNARKYFFEGIDKCETGASLAEYCSHAANIMITAGYYDDALFISSKGTGYDSKYSVECLFYKGEALFLSGDKILGAKYMLEAIDTEGTGIFDEKSYLVKRYRKLGL